MSKAELRKSRNRLNKEDAKGIFNNKEPDCAPGASDFDSDDYNNGFE